MVAYTKSVRNYPERCPAPQVLGFNGWTGWTSVLTACRICLQSYHSRQYHVCRRSRKGLRRSPLAKESSRSYTKYFRHPHHLNSILGQADRPLFRHTHIPDLPLGRLRYHRFHR